MFAHRLTPAGFRTPSAGHSIHKQCPLTFALCSSSQRPKISVRAFGAPQAAAPGMAVDQAVMVDRVRGALWGLLIADALSMPVHWYYNPSDIARDYGTIMDFQPPRARHPSSIMNLSNTGGHGRGGQSGRIVGDVINHGKHQFWGKPGMHYHQGMVAGENTLNALCARVVTRGIAAKGRYDPARFLKDYVSFMTTPGSHNDTYAESFHRDFFANWAKGVPPERCALGTEGHNTAQIGGFVMLAPVVMAAAVQGGAGAGGAAQAALSHLALTHDSRKLQGYAQTYAQMLYDVTAGGRPLREVTGEAATRMGIDLEKLTAPNSGYDDIRVVHGVFGSACYIEDSFPVTLYLAHKYADSFEKAVLANTNVGGENCHRGAALGALMGAALGEAAIPQRFIQGLHDHAAIKAEIDAFTAALFK